ncbi:hypothetical protein [Kalamiella sp. sgz302252]|uniref:hypothetical protein n=1 Tax=Pantoea sp. sgz302252 TaxID=3341827 RepID=UPI0036D23BDA
MSHSQLAQALFFIALASSPLVTQAANSGVIHFSGAIVDTGCDMKVEQGQATASCFRDGETEVLPISLQPGKMPLATLAHTEITWLDSERQQGVLTITYR